MTNKRFMWHTEGKAHPENFIKGDKYRFTFLTSRLIRMEYAADGIFEDRASQHIFYRNLPKTDFTAKTDNGILTVETEHLILTYSENAEFSKEALTVRLKSTPATVWKYGDALDDLGGTVSTLDGVNGFIPLESGLCSRNGFVVFDDSDSSLLADDGWFDIRRDATRDIYIFAYGYDYLNCIKDYYRITGAPPLLPNYALGNWWSRFHPYTQEEYCELMDRFDAEEIPFSVAVIDMDWHKKGWTGYSWNRELIPDYKEFLSCLHKKNLKTALNLHPAGGVAEHEDMYDEMATAMGVDPNSKETVKFDCLNPKFMESYFDILHHPYEKDGVDFWWMDWQQGTDYSWVHDEKHPASPLEKINPLWLLNHLHILDIMTNGKRPMFFSRYCGLGSHRYPVGFSGDTIMTWESLDFQPYFTSTASNVGYSWWSHDIGGHMGGYRDDEMILRWMQYGVFSPINRLHSSNSIFNGKEPWNLQKQYDVIAREYLRLRHKLFPYIYTMNYRNHSDLIPMILPMYYTHPQSNSAYNSKNQYWFGSELMVIPVTQKADKTTSLAKTEVWLPKGNWIDAFNGFVYSGNKTVDIYRDIEQMPIFAKLGAIVPMQEFGGDNKLGNKADMQLFVFAGDNNSFTLYEDEGEYSNYQNGKFAKTNIELKWNDTAKLIINNSVGDLSLIPDKRNWTVNFRGFNNPNEVYVTVDGIKSAAEFRYNEANATITVSLKNVSANKLSEIEIIPKTDGLMYNNSYSKQRMFDIILHSQMSNLDKDEIWKHIEAKGKNWLFAKCTNIEQQTLLGAVIEMIDIS